MRRQDVDGAQDLEERVVVNFHAGLDFGDKALDESLDVELQFDLQVRVELEDLADLAEMLLADVGLQAFQDEGPSCVWQLKLVLGAHEVDEGIQGLQAAGLLQVVLQEVEAVYGRVVELQPLISDDVSHEVVEVHSSILSRL